MIRVALDTNIVRNVVQSVPSQDTFWAFLMTTNNQFSYSLTELAVLELTLQLIEGRIPWLQWMARREAVNGLLDPAKTVVSGKTAVRLARRDPRIAAYQSHYRAVPPGAFWQHLLHVDSHDNLVMPFASTDALGNPMKASLSAKALAKIIADSREQWVEFINTTRDAFRNASQILESIGLGGLTHEHRDELSRHFFRFAEQSEDPRLDAYLETTIRLARLADLPRGYNPSSHPNDALDLNMLIALLDADLLITADSRLSQHVAAAYSPSPSPVVTQKEFRARVELMGTLRV